MRAVALAVRGARRSGAPSPFVDCQLRHAGPPSAAPRPRRSSASRWNTRAGMATMAPAALPKRSMVSRSQPDSRPWQTAPPKLSPAPSPLMTDTGVGGTSTTSSLVMPSTPLGPCLTIASSTPAVQQRLPAALAGSVSPTAISHSSLFPMATVTCGSALADLAGRLGRVLPEHRPVIQVQHGQRPAWRAPPRPRDGRTGSAPRTDPVTVVQKMPRVGDGVQVELLRPDHQIGGDRQAVEQQREMVRRVHLAEGHRGEQVRHVGDEPVVHPHPAHAPDARTSEGIRSGSGDQRRPPAVLGRGDGHVAGTAADALAERVDVLEPHIVLQRIQVDPDPSHRQHLEMSVHSGPLALVVTVPRHRARLSRDRRAEFSSGVGSAALP